MKENVIPAWLQERRVDRIIEGELRYSTSRHADDVESTSLTRDVAFNRHSINDGHHVSPFDNGKILVGEDGIEVALVQGIDEVAFRRTLSAATRATIGIDIEPKWEKCHADPYNDAMAKCAFMEHRAVGNDGVSNIHEHLVDPLDDNEDWDEMLKGGLQTALETQVIVFAVKGASRTATHQMVRSRKAAFHQQSQRASYMGDFPECRIPESVWVNPVARRAFIDSVMTAHSAYRKICEQDISYQDARFVLPEGTANFILLEYSVREFMNVYAYRGCSMFQWEIVSAMRKCRQLLVDAYPWIEPHVKISCEKTGPVAIRIESEGVGTHEPMLEHACTFQGWENVEGQCSFPWAKEKARTFQPRFHKIERRKEEA